jgi:hypothetical protein
MTYGAFHLATEQYYFIKNEKAYVITFSAEEGKPMDLGEKILQSFRFLE